MATTEATRHETQKPRGRRDRPCGCCRNERSGIVVMELAVICPLMVLLVLGALELGRYVAVRQILTSAAREGAREAVLQGATTASVLQKPYDYLDAANIEGWTVTVTPDPPETAPAGEPVSVTVQVPFDQVSWLPGTVFLKGRVVSATSTMPHE